MSFIIMTDTAANLDAKFVKANDIVLIPLSYLIDGKPHYCLTPDEFNDEEYYRDIKNGLQVTTSQVNPQEYIDSMTPVLEAGNDILFVGLSSGISGSFASAEIAAKSLEERFPERSVKLVDSLGAALGEGLLVIHAAKCRKNGMTLDETVERLQTLRKKIYQVFIVDDLMHLKRTGRLSGGSAIVGSVLGIKPLLKGSEEGKSVPCGKVRGRKQAIKALADKYFELAQKTVKQTIAITYSACKEDAEYLADLIKEKLPPMEIILQKHEPVTGSHLGPGALALFFEGDAKVRAK